MSSSRAYQITEHGGAEQLRLVERNVAWPGPGEVRVRLRAMALNHLDLWVRRGIPGVRFPLPLIPGSDGAGEIESLGDGVDGPAPGTPVFILPGVSCSHCPACLEGKDNLCASYEILGESRDGTACELIVLPAENVAEIPEGLSFAEAAAFPLTFMTAWQMLVHKARLQAGERVLVHAAASGVSSAAIQIARLHGARVATTASSEEKLRVGRELGAELALSYHEKNWLHELRNWAGPTGIDVVVDHVGENTFAPSIRALAKGGRYVFCGASSGFALRSDFRPIFFKNQEILGSTMGRKADLPRIASLIALGRLAPLIASRLPFEELAEGHRRLEAHQVIGKIVVEIG